MDRKPFLIAAAAASIFAASCAHTQRTALMTAVFAGGRSGYLEVEYGKLYGVISVEAGYTGGSTSNPTYSSYAAGGHREAVRVSFDPDRVGYADLLETFWRSIDPTDSGGQFLDRGPQFAPALYWLDRGQKNEAEASKAALAASRRFPKAVVTPILQAGTFYPAAKGAAGFAPRIPNAERDSFMRKIWGERTPDPDAPPSAPGGSYAKPAASELARRLTPLQFEVTQNNGTEPPYANEYANNHEEGIYVDVVSGEPLFSSRDKYESGTGWPSFTMPLAPSNVLTKTDTSFGMVRIEVRSRYADSHLGHLFDDGPAPTGLRYCMNSASMRFIPVGELEKEGYGRYLALFKDGNK